jgi:phenylacetate-CoA ligase
MMVATVPRSGDQERLDRLAELLARVLAGNAFQRGRLGEAPLTDWDDLARLPLTTKDELLADQAAHPPFGTNLTFDLEHYTHLHQTSGTTGATLRVLDTAEDWDWWRRQLARVLTATGIGPGDRVALAHSFGPYVQFWASYEGAQEAGALVIPLGGMDSVQRLETMAEYGATALLCTPSYALHLAKVAAERGLSGAMERVERIVCTGEPGASMPAVRERIEAAWGARCFDHAGASEVGPFAYPCAADGGLHLFEDEFICEILDPASGAPVDEGEAGELVMTALGRVGFPVVRFRTGDMVERHARRCSAGHDGLWLPQGILGRADDMVVIRGMNVFPSAIEEILRQSSGVGEFSITFYNDPHAMDEVKVEAELAQPREARAIQDRLRQRLGLRVRIVPVRPGILPTYTGKARRVHDLRPTGVRGGRP